MRKLALLLALAVFGWLLLITKPGNFLLARAGGWLVETTPLHHADVIVALGGDRARQEKAVELYRQGLAPFVLFTGADARDRDYGCLGIPPVAAVAVPRPVFTTSGEGDSVREIADKNGYRSILLVTSPYHSRRALAAFRRAFRGSSIEIELSVCDNPPFLRQPWWKSHMGVKTILAEYVGLAYYRIKGYL